jgi:hypothetical protein
VRENEIDVNEGEEAEREREKGSWYSDERSSSPISADEAVVQNIHLVHINYYSRTDERLGTNVL